MATRTWDGGGGDNLASTAANWDGPDTVPVTGDDVIFDGTSTKNCTWDLTSSVNLLSMDVQSAYTGTITVAASSRIRASGTFTFNAVGTLDVNGAESGIAIFVGSFDASGSSTKTVNAGADQWTINAASGAFNISGTNLTWNEETSTILIDGTPFTITAKSGAEFNNLSFASTGSRTVTLGSDLTINGTFNAASTGNSLVTFNGNTINAKGDINKGGNSGETRGTTTIVINGTGAQAWADTRWESPTPIEINKASGTLTLIGTISSKGLTHTAGTVAGGTSLMQLNTGSWDTSGMTFFNVENGANPATLLSNMNVGGFFDIRPGGSVAINGFTLFVAGDLKQTSVTNTSAGGTTVIELNGTGAQAWSASGVGSSAFIANPFVINKSGGTLTQTTDLLLKGDYTHTAGTVAFGSTKISWFDSSPTVDASALTFNDISALTNLTRTMTVTTSMTIGGTLDLNEGGGNFTYSGGTLNVEGDLKKTGTAIILGTSAIEINGTGAQDWSASSSGRIEIDIDINKASGTLTQSSDLFLRGNYTHTTGTVSFGSTKITFSSAMTIDANALTFNDISFSQTGDSIVTITTSMTIAGTFIASAGSATTTANGGTINVKGNLAQTSNGLINGSSPLAINGTGSQDWSSAGVGTLGLDITINKASGTLTLTGTLVIGSTKNFTHTLGTVTAGSSTLQFTAITFDTSGMNWNNLVNKAGTSVLLSDLNVDGEFDGGNAGSSPAMNGFKINLIGNLTMSSGGSISHDGNTVIEINGTGAQAWSHTVGTTRFTNPITINKASGTLTISGTITTGGTITHTTGTVSATGTMFISTSPTTFDTSGMSWNNIDIGGNIILSSDLNVDGALDTGVGAANITSNGFKIFAGGNLEHTNNVNCLGTGIIEITGNGIQTWTCGITGTSNSVRVNLIINKSGGTLNMSGLLTWFSGNTMTFTAGTVAPGTSELVNQEGVTFDINGMDLFDLTLSSVLTNNSAFTVTNDFDVANDGSTVTINGSTITVQGDLQKSGTGLVLGTAVIEIGGTGAQDWSQTGGTNEMRNDVTINKASGTLTLSGTIKYTGGVLTHTTGTMDGGTSTFEIVAGTTGAWAGIGLDFNNMLLTGTLDGGTSTMRVSGNWTNNGTFTAGTSTVILDG